MTTRCFYSVLASANLDGIRNGDRESRATKEHVSYQHPPTYRFSHPLKRALGLQLEEAREAQSPTFGPETSFSGCWVGGSFCSGSPAQIWDQHQRKCGERLRDNPWARRTRSDAKESPAGKWEGRGSPKLIIFFTDTKSFSIERAESE